MIHIRESQDEGAGSLSRTFGGLTLTEIFIHYSPELPSVSVCETRPGGSTATVDLSRPRARIHVDFAGPFLGQMLLLVDDAYSKWAEVRMMHGWKYSDGQNN